MDLFFRIELINTVLQETTRNTNGTELTIDDESCAKGGVTIRVGDTTGVKTLIVETNILQTDAYSAGFMIWHHPLAPGNRLTIQAPGDIEGGLAAEEAGLQDEIVTISGKQRANLLDTWGTLSELK